ncbi:hypothetical protein PWT90_04953 [Aphanocladium album]|nr:hypothetical protein PWT90_04953 [Aphanocladium album]
MTSLRLAIASSILLIQAAASTINGNECPNGWSFTQMGGSDKVYCCYGSSTINNNDGYCCVHGSTFVSGADSGGGGGGGNDYPLGGDVTDSCFPFCSATTTSPGNGKRAFPSQQCIDKVPFTASDYSERVSAASKSAAASQTSGSQPSSNSAAATTTKSDANGGAGSSTAAAGSGSNGSSSGSAQPTHNAAAPAITQGVMQVGGLVAAAAMLVV